MKIERNTCLYPQIINDTTFKLKDSFGNYSITVQEGSKLYNLIKKSHLKPLTHDILLKALSKDLLDDDEVEYSYQHSQLSMLLSLNGPNIALRNYYCKGLTQSDDDGFYDYGYKDLHYMQTSELFKFHTDIEQLDASYNYLNDDIISIIIPRPSKATEDGVDHIATVHLARGFNRTGLEASNIELKAIETGKDILVDITINTTFIKE